MPQLSLYAPDITCEHCITTIGKAVSTVEGARFVAGDPDAKTFVVELARGAVLDRLAETLAAEGYPLGDAPAPGASPASGGMTMLAMADGAHGAGAQGAGGFRPDYLKIERTAAGADITFSCPCGSTTEVFRLDRAQAEQAPHSCCGHYTLVGVNAAQRLRQRLGDGYDIDVQTLTMPWGQPLEAAMAVAR